VGGRGETHHRIRVAATIGGAVACLGVAGFVFYREDVRYSFPTPKPSGLVQPSRGEQLPIERWMAGANVAARGQPVLFHFFNPHCPCSRFNLDHLRTLRARYGERVTFVGVVQAPVDDEDDRVELRRRLDDLGFDLPWVLDPAGQIAGEAGVYSTPQAVFTDARGRLIYRGNYNASRYCTDARTEFVRIAIEAFLTEQGPMPPDTPAYGCELPSITAKSPESPWAQLLR
jgi:hypothetical protein